MPVTERRGAVEAPLANNPNDAGSNPAPATNDTEGSSDAPFFNFSVLESEEY